MKNISVVITYISSEIDSQSVRQSDREEIYNNNCVFNIPVFSHPGKAGQSPFEEQVNVRETFVFVAL